MNRTALLLAATATATAFGLTACGTSSGDETAASSPTSATTSSVATGPTATGVGQAICTDASGDGGAADLVSVGLVDGGDGLQATFTLAAPLQTGAGTAQLSLSLSSADGDIARQLGVKWVDGEASVFVFDLGSAKNKYVDAPPVVDGPTVTVTFPQSATDGLGETWRWGGTSSVDGTDVDACPEPGDDVLNPARQTFPG